MRFPPTRLHLRAALAPVLVALALPCLAQVATPASPPPAAAASPVKPAAPPSLSDVVVAAARADALRREVEAALAAGGDSKSLESKLEGVEARVEDGLRRLRHGELLELRYDTLVDIEARIRERQRDVGAVTAALGSRLARLEREIDRVEREIAAWPDRVRATIERKAPDAIVERTKSIEPQLATARDELRARRDEVVLAFDRGTRLQTQLDSLRAEVAERRDAIGRRLRTAEEAPIWAPSRAHEEHGVLRSEFGIARQLLADYLRDEGLLLLLGLAAIAVAVGATLRRRDGARAAEPVRRRDALAAGAVVGAVVLAFVAPTGPTAFYPLWWLPVPLLAAWTADRMLGVAARRTLWALAFAGSLNTFNTIAELQPGADRLLLALQALPLVFALVADWRSGALDRQLTRWHPTTVRTVALVLIAALATALAASVLGFVGLARSLRGIAITATSAAMVFSVVAGVAGRVIDVLLAAPLAQRLRGVREEGETVRRFLGYVVVLAAATGWLLLLVYTQNLADSAKSWMSAATAAKISVRDIDISAGGVALSVLIVLATAAAVRVVRFLLTVEILPRFGLRQGVPFAISTLASYAVAVIGFVLALAALGVDLTKVTLLAGALGIGIGFGLQNIVNNFVSGLILVLERPVNVGDQVAIGDLIGDVRRIGIRASTVRTVQGAEVIVPNADLVSKQVVNWTLSDRSRRYEIDVGVAYGSDVDAVMRLLEEAAAGVPEVKKSPPPRVLFAGFGESSLDFRVLAWAESVDVGLQAQNNLRRAILAGLNAAGIGIPYPQRDVHVRSTDAPAARAQEAESRT